VINLLEERKINLLSQIEKLRREIDGLKWLEYRGMALYHCKFSIRYLFPDKLRENSRN
jgi:type II secretory pathway component PulL